MQGERVEQTGEGDDVTRRVVAMLHDSVVEAGEGNEEGGVLLTASWPSRVRDCTRKQKAGRPLLHDIIQRRYQARPRPPVHETVFPPDLHFPLLLTCYLLSIRPRVTETLSYFKLAYGLPTSFSTLWHVGQIVIQGNR